MDKKQKIIVVGGVCASISVITAIVLLRNYYKREPEWELTKEELRELEYDEYMRPTGYKSKTFNVIQSHEEMRERTTRERFRMAGEDDRNFENEKERKEELEEHERPTGYKSKRFNVFQAR